MDEFQKTIIANAYPDTEFYDDNFCTVLFSDIHVCIEYGDQITNVCMWDTKGTNFTDKIEKLFEYMKVVQYEESDKYCISLDYLKWCLSRDICDEIAFSNYDGTIDKLWNFLKLKYNVNISRKLHIVTWGSVFVSKNPIKCQRVFNSGCLRGSATKKEINENKDLAYKILLKSRGTDPQVQEEVRGAVLYEKFIEDIVKEIEENNLNTI